MDAQPSSTGTPEYLLQDHVARANAIVARTLYHPPPLPNVLCEPCRRMVETLKSHWATKDNSKRRRWMRKEKSNIRSKTAVPHHPNISALLASASDCCHLCAIFAGDDVRLRLDVVNVSICQYHVEATDCGEYGWLRLFLDLGESEGRRSMSRIIHIDPKTRTTMSTLASRRTDSESTFQIISRWINSCMGNHTECSVPRAYASQLPRRLIEICYGDGGLSARLRLTKSLSRSTTYVCLSHCWGGTSCVKLTQDNEESFCYAIELSSLPQSFLDAVVITKRLGYSYLWIDSLCIIQDSRGDRSDQIPIMGEIYRNSILTIAALKAKNSQGGCFTTRNPLAYSDCTLPRFSQDGDCFVIMNTEDLLFGSNSDDESRTPLQKRGWVIQERAMAPRTIYFGSVMVDWECVECVASEVETGFTEAPVARRQAMSRQRISQHGMKYSLAQLFKPHGSWGYVSWSTFWWEVVERYTSCQLTYSSDRWPAIAGLAAVVQQKSGLTLCHGLWREHMYDDLLWRGGRGNRLSNDAPSWSWLSIDSCVSNRGSSIPRRQRTAIVHADSETSRSSSGGQITITAPMMEIKSVVKRLHRYEVLTKDKQSFQLHWKRDIELGKHVDAWALQFRATPPAHSYREYLGLVVVPVDETGTKWSRVGYYEFHVWGMKALASPKHLGKLTTVTLV